MAERSQEAASEERSGYAERVRFEDIILKQLDRILSFRKDLLYAHPNMQRWLEGREDEIQTRMVDDLLAYVPQSWKDDQYTEELAQLKADRDEFLKKWKADPQHYDSFNERMVAPKSKDLHWLCEHAIQATIDLLDRRGLLLSKDRVDEF